MVIKKMSAVIAPNLRRFISLKIYSALELVFRVTV